jgi:hypothetical protein
MITAAMKQQLRELGYTDMQIREMRPAEAHQIINTAYTSGATRYDDFPK